MDEASKFPSISQHRIPYPLPEHLHRLHDVYKTGGKSLPDILAPGYNPDQRYGVSMAMLSVVRIPSFLVGWLLARS